MVLAVTDADPTSVYWPVEKYKKKHKEERGLIYKRAHRQIQECLENLSAFLNGEGFKELCPQCGLIRDLQRNERIEEHFGIDYVNLAGSSTVFTRLYLYLRLTGRFHKLLTFFNLPSRLPAPEKIRNGTGDGAVAVARAKMSFGRFYPYEKSHGMLLIDDDVKKRVLDECNAV
ncbi:MAG: hypothetical protein BMS9Abin37_1097 [Acidobacteriota bacterium]|nr:MAG: hypothetical protein BMS9Abin37_1097 [Acidobacteriota bacterium]